MPPTPIDPDGSIQRSILEIIDLARSSRTDAAAMRLELLEHDGLPESAAPASADTAAMVDPITSIRFYVRLALADLAGGAAETAVVSLERAVAILAKSS
jgi:hypothetical protein